jgi:hypothetical protein
MTTKSSGEADAGVPGGTRGASHPVNDDHIRERAYLIWIDEGRPDGREVDHWLRAKWELEGEHDKKG